MFSLEPDASKVALSALVRRCLDRGIAFIDCQARTAHLRSLGSRAVPRTEFLALLVRHCAPGMPSRWRDSD
jgi:leucyl/phenylalanyl-tRNA--protein transferase